MNAKWIGIVVLVAIVAAAAAGFGGFTYGKSVGQAQAVAIRTNFFQGRGDASGAAAGTGGQGAGRFNSDNFATGQVKQVSGDTIDLSTATNVLQVKVTSQTQIQKMGTGSLTDIQPGERLVIQGTRASDGTFTAQTIQIGRAGFGGPGAGAQGGGTTATAGGQGTTNQ